MPRFVIKLIVQFLSIFFMAGVAVAQTSVPDFRYVVTQDMDFYGADLDALFDTDLNSCVRACSANRQCAAFTFNTRSNSCFPKSGVSDQTPYEGAISAQKIATPADITQRGAARMQALDVLRDRDFTQAATLARDLGLRHRAGGRDIEAVLGAMRASASDPVRALGWTGVAVSLTDRSDLWGEYARRLLQIEPDARRRSEVRAMAISAALNSYLRSDTAGAQVTALEVLSQALERSGRGRDMVSVLRVASEIQPREDILAALESAIAKYGFRVVDSTVESDAAAPRICVQFSEPLEKASVDYDPFVQLPTSTLSVQADDQQLCVDGVEHGERYRFTLRKGLPAASGETLHRDVTLTHYVRDRSPSVRFPGRSYVLPKTAEAALPVETVNLTQIDLRLRRVSDRNLLRAVQDGFFGRPLSQWQDQQFASEIAQEVWTGTAEVASELNRDMTARLPLTEAIAGQPAGIYALTARVPGADPYDDPGATQWFVLSDLGLRTVSGTDGLHVSVMGLGDAKPRVGVEVTLISKANAVLAEAATDATGIVRFDAGLTRGSGAAAPAMVFARQGDSDIGFLSLTDPAFDLSDRGVEGRPAPGPVDVFLTTDRGAYRAGEVINATVLARDHVAQAIDGLPMTAILSRPDGVEYLRRVSNGGVAGGHVFALPVDASVPRGSWRLDIKSDPKGAVLASQTVLVEDFLPERIDFDQSLPAASLRPGDSVPLSIDARYLFGAPGSDLTTDGQVVIRTTQELAAYPGYRFGRYDSSVTAQSSYFGGERTDAQGKVQLFVDIPQIDAAGRPLEATVITRLADGSARPVERRLNAQVNPPTDVIGIKPLFEDVVAEGSEAAFQVIGLTPDLTPQPMRVRWTLNRVETRYQWYQLYGNWNWEPTTRRTRIATGEADLGSDPLTVSQPVDWGEYELVVERLDGTYTAAALDFYAGWYQGGDSSVTPDRLELSLDKDIYAIGDTAQLRIVPRMGGTALIQVMANEVIHREMVEVTAGDTRIPLTVTKDWGSGAYVTATVIRPMDVSAGQNPARALGLVHAIVEPEGRKLAVAIETPEVVRPRQTQKVGVSVTGAADGDDVYLTLAAIDVGILNLTGFESPDPQGHYFGQRRLGVELRDVYGRLIDGMNGAIGQVRSGGDADNGMRMQSPPPTQDLMAVFSGTVKVGPDGRAEVEVPLPAFNGTVRLMAVAWSPSAVGQAEHEMLVRDPVVLTASLPRFLAPGDSSRMLLEAVHADGGTGEMQLRVTTNGVQLGDVPASFALGTGEKKSFAIPIRAGGVGDPKIELALTTPDGVTLTQSLRMPVRANDPVVAQTRRFSLVGGDSFLFSDDVFAGLQAGSARAVLSAGPLAKFDAPGLLSTLDRYPYGCTEQITSQTMPLLYLSSVAQATGLGSGPKIAAQIDAAISRVLTRQASNGAFGLWRAESGDFWLDAYVSDFLSRARAEGYVIPDRAFAQAMDNLRNRINYAPDFDFGGEDVAYALMVLAREGAASMGDLRYYADVKAEAFATPLAVAQLGAALAMYGDQTRADALFARSAGLFEEHGFGDNSYWRADYGTTQRDAAGLLALAAEAGSVTAQNAALINQVSQTNDRLSTQEAAWTLLAAQALIKSPEHSGLLVNGAPVSGPFVQVLQGAASDSYNITAADGQTTEVTLTTLGVPEVAPPAGGTGYGITRQYYSMEGAPLDRRSFAVGERFVTVLTVDPFENSGARLMIDDPLPAGIEIDNPSLLQSGDVRSLDWLDLSEAQHAEFRSDRFLAAVDMDNGNSVTVAYVARAVTPGEFHHPAAAVEDLYRPRYRARTETGRVEVTQ